MKILILSILMAESLSCGNLIPNRAIESREMYRKAHKVRAITKQSGFILNSDSTKAVYIPGKWEVSQKVRYYEKVCDHFIEIPQ
jgi:hypothetical protein